jgi:drug/metabolite transporter (DMT)-like permease
MFYLLVVSIIWGFSFGLIKNGLAGVDANFLAAARLGIALLVFLPFLRLRGVSRKLAGQLLLVGAFQFGLMYVAYNYAFHFLKAYEVALFTIFTPIYVTLINDALQRRLNFLHLFTTLLAVAGAALVKGGALSEIGALTGFFIVQASNLCFAFGQVYYRRVMAAEPQVRDRAVFALPYLGGTLAAGLSAALFTPWHQLALSSTQFWMLLYLGAVASGISFFLWNLGARRVNTGTLAIFNDLKIPLAVAISLLFFGEQASLPNLVAGGTLVILALVLNEAGTRRLAAIVPAPEPDI